MRFRINFEVDDLEVEEECLNLLMKALLIEPSLLCIGHDIVLHAYRSRLLLEATLARRTLVPF